MLSATAGAVGTSRGGAVGPGVVSHHPLDVSNARSQKQAAARARIRASDHLLSAERPEYAPGVVVYQRVRVVGSVALFAFSVCGICMALGAPGPSVRAAAQLLDVNVQRVGCPLRGGER